MSNKTTVADFNYWCREVTHWMRRFGLQDWEVRYMHLESSESTPRAMVSYDVSARLATFKLYRDWGDCSTSPLVLARVALHEVLHLVLADMSNLVRRRYNVSEFDEDRAEHAVLRRLEDALLPTRAVGRSRRATRARPRGRA